MTRKKFFWFIKIGIGILLIYIIYRQVGQKQAILKAFTSANVLLIIVSLVFLIPNIFVQFLKWRYLLVKNFGKINKRLVLGSLFFGATLGFITPGNVGELGRALYFKDHDKLVVMGLNIVDKIFGMIIFISMGLISINVLIQTKMVISNPPVILIHILTILLLAMIWLIVLYPRFLIRLIGRLKKIGDMRPKLKLIFTGFSTLKRSNAIILSVFNLIWLCIIILQYHFLINAFTNVPLTTSILSVTAALFIKILLPISFGDLGVREGAVVFFFSLFKISSVAAFNTSFLIFIINFCIPAVIGSYFVLRLKWGVPSENSILLEKN